MENPSISIHPRRRCFQNRTSCTVSPYPQICEEPLAHRRRGGLHGCYCASAIWHPLRRGDIGNVSDKPHLEMLFRRVDQVVFCFDGDEAGRKAAFRGMEAALPMMEDGRQVKFLFLPEGEDPDSVVRNKGSQHLEHLFDNADPLETFLFDQMAQGIDLDTMDGKARLSKLVAPYINLIPDGVFKTLLFKSLATRTDMDVESLRRLREIEKPVTADYDSAPGPEPGEMQATADAPFDYPEGYEPPHDSENHYGAPVHLEPHSAVLLRALGLLVLKPSSASAITDELLPEQAGCSVTCFTTL